MDPLAPQAAALRILRIIWAAMLVSLVVFAGLLMPWLGQSPPVSPRLDPEAAQIGLLVGMVAVTAVGYFIRMQCYKRHWVGDAVTPRGYLTGNLVLFVLLEGFCFLTLAVMLATGRVAELLLPGVVTLVLLAINFPTGLPMTSYHTLE